MVFLNARTFHAYTTFQAESGYGVRPFAPLMFKDGGPPHRHTQPVPPHWLEGEVGPWRRRILDRQPFSADPDDDELPNAWQLAANL